MEISVTRKRKQTWVLNFEVFQINLSLFVD
jgi:hypothetical protein